MNPLHLREHHVFFRDSTIDRLADARRHISNFAFDLYPLIGEGDDVASKDKRNENKRKRIRGDAEIIFMTLVAVQATPRDSATARVAWKDAHSKLARTPQKGTGQYELFYTLRPEWATLDTAFAGVRKNYNGGPRTPEYTVFGYTLATLTDEVLKDFVTRACARVTAKKEVTA